MNGRGGIRGAIARYRGRDIELKTHGQLEAMRVAGALVAATLAAVALANLAWNERVRAM